MLSVFEAKAVLTGVKIIQQKAVWAEATKFNKLRAFAINYLRVIKNGNCVFIDKEVIQETRLIEQDCLMDSFSGITNLVSIIWNSKSLKCTHVEMAAVN